MKLSLRELLRRLPRYVVLVNVSEINGESGDWEELSLHDSLLDALRRCSAFMASLKNQIGIQLTSTEADERLEPWIKIVDRVEESTVVWIENDRLNVSEEASEILAPKPSSKTAPIPNQLLAKASKSSPSAPPPTVLPPPSIESP